MANLAHDPQPIDHLRLGRLELGQWRILHLARCWYMAAEYVWYGGGGGSVWRCGAWRHLCLRLESRYLPILEVVKQLVAARSADSGLDGAIDNQIHHLSVQWVAAQQWLSVQ